MYETINVDIPVDMVICRVSYIIRVTWVDEPIAIWPKIESRPHTNRTEFWAPKFGSFFGWKGSWDETGYFRDIYTLED